MQESMPNAAQEPARLFANGSSASRPLTRSSLALRSFLTRLSLVSRSTFTNRFPWLSLIPQLSIFESNSMTTSTFNPNT